MNEDLINRTDYNDYRNLVRGIGKQSTKPTLLAKLGNWWWLFKDEIVFRLKEFLQKGD